MTCHLSSSGLLDRGCIAGARLGLPDTSPTLLGWNRSRCDAAVVVPTGHHSADAHGKDWPWSARFCRRLLDAQGIRVRDKFEPGPGGVPTRMFPTCVEKALYIGLQQQTKRCGYLSPLLSSILYYQFRNVDGNQLAGCTGWIFAITPESTEFSSPTLLVKPRHHKSESYLIVVEFVGLDPKNVSE